MWIWWVASPDQLSPAAELAIANALDGGGPIHVSSISCWEIALLVKQGRLRLTSSAADWVARCAALPFLRFVPVDNQIALRSIDLDGLHEDPADRLIVATALCLGMPLITKDRRLHAHPQLRAVW